MKVTTRLRPARRRLAELASGVLYLVVMLAVPGVARAQDDPQKTAAPPAASASAPVAAPPASPAAAKPFKDVVKDAKERKGYFTLYQKDDKVWMEIRPEQLGKPFFFSYNIASSVGERGLYGSQMGRSFHAEFRKIGNQMQLLARNQGFYASPGSPQAQVVAQAFSDSLLGSAPVVSLPHPDSKSVLIDASALLFNDIAGYSTDLESAFRLNFSLDKPNTSFSKVDVDEQLAGFLVNAHFSVARLAAAPLTPPTTPVPPPPRNTPDARSLFVGFYYNFTPLPVEPMRPRLADDRVGHFVTSSLDFTDDLKPKNTRHFVNRWRLEKAEPNAALSEPKQAITFWLDKNIPEKYRQSVVNGVLLWNSAFEKIGFKNALVARQQTDTDSFDTLDARHASVRWFVGSDVGFAIGPSRVDQRTGEILDADIGMSDVFARGARRLVAEDLNPLARQSQGHGHLHGQGADCAFSAEAALEMGFAMDLLEARGELDMGSPQADALAQAYVKEVIAHEVGHTLGLRHNFRASTIYTLKQLQDPEFTRVNGLGGSVMDYIPFNLALAGEPQGEYMMSTLGPYDHWAIEYAYKPIAPEQEAQELARIAGRSTEALLAFGTDEDASTASVADPGVNTFDLGADPLAYVQKRLALSRELWDRLQKRTLKVGESYESLRRSFEYGMNQFLRTVPLATKYVGGTTFLRDHAGTGRAPFTPIPAVQQRQALKLVSEVLFTAKSFVFSPELISRLGVDHFDRANRSDVSATARLLALQSTALEQLMSDVVATRVLNAAEKVDNPGNVLSLHELYNTLQSSIWSELTTGGEISSTRRNLQREHLKRLAQALVKPLGSSPADARSLHRLLATGLLAKINAAAGRPLSIETKAHLMESQTLLTDALKAPLSRNAV